MDDPQDRLYESLLVLRCQTGDERAFVEIVERYHARLRLFLRQMLSDEHAAEDLLQEVWLDVFRSVGTLREPGAFAGWLFRMGRNRAYRVLRRRGVPTVSLETEAIAEIPGSEGSNGNIDFDEANLVNESLDNLPHEQREVLLLRFVERMSYEQIAAAVGCELGTVRSRLHYGKLAMRRDLERKDDR